MTSLNERYDLTTLPRQPVRTKIAYTEILSNLLWIFFQKFTVAPPKTGCDDHTLSIKLYLCSLVLPSLKSPISPLTSVSAAQKFIQHFIHTIECAFFDLIWKSTFSLQIFVFCLNVFLFFFFAFFSSSSGTRNFRAAKGCGFLSLLSSTYSQASLSLSLSVCLSRSEGDVALPPEHWRSNYRPEHCSPRISKAKKKISIKRQLSFPVQLYIIYTYMLRPFVNEGRRRKRIHPGNLGAGLNFFGVFLS